MRFIMLTTLWASLTNQWATAITTTSTFNTLPSRRIPERTMGRLQPNSPVPRGASTDSPPTTQSDAGTSDITSTDSSNLSISQSTTSGQNSETFKETGEIFNSTFPLRDAINGSSVDQCDTICQHYSDLDDRCITLDCTCSPQFFSAEEACTQCAHPDAGSIASTRIKIEATTAQCRRAGFQVDFSGAKLSPESQAIVDQFHAESALLRRQQRVFLALQIVGGHVGLPIVLAFALFSRKAKRDLTFHNFCITWIFSSILYSLLLYKGIEYNNFFDRLGDPSPKQCLSQATLSEGAQVMTAGSTLALVMRLWLGLRTAIYGESKPRNQIATIGLFIGPYLLFAILLVTTIFVQMSWQPALANVSNFYCTIEHPDIFVRAVYGVMLGLLIITLLFDASIMAILYRHWRVSRRAAKTKSPISLSLLLRVTLFSLYRIVVAVAYVSVVKGTQSQLVFKNLDSELEGNSTLSPLLPVWVDMLQAAIPLVATIIFGISDDIISTITFWRKWESRGIVCSSPTDSDATAVTHCDNSTTGDHELGSTLRNTMAEV